MDLQLKTQALLQRIGEITTAYEEHIADLKVRLHETTVELNQLKEEQAADRPAAAD